MKKNLLLSCGLFLGITFSSMANAADPCDNLKGYWNGGVWDLNNKTACRVHYKLYRSYENIRFSPVIYGLDCTLTPTVFNAVCKEGKITAEVDNHHLTGTAFDEMVDMSGDDYTIQLYKS